MTFSFTIIGAPRTKNTGKISTGRGMRVFPSRMYREWFASAKRQAVVGKMAARLAGVALPLKCPVEVTAVFYRDRDVGDEDRYCIGLGDYLERCGFVANDKQIHWSGGTRREIDRDRPRVEVTLAAIQDAKGEA